MPATRSISSAFRSIRSGREEGNLRADYDVILMPTQAANRAAVFAPPAARPVPYQKTDKFKFGDYGSSPDISGGMGARAWVHSRSSSTRAHADLHSQAVQFPTELGLARTVAPRVDAELYAPPLVNAGSWPEHPVFYGYTGTIIPLKYLGGPLMSVEQPDQGPVLARYPGNDANVLSSLMRNADDMGRPFAIDGGRLHRQGRVVVLE